MILFIVTMCWPSRHHPLPSVNVTCFENCVVFWSRGLPITWSSDLVIFWSRGLLISWSSDFVVFWSRGLLISWSSDLKVFWSRGLLIQWYSDLVDFWSRGLPISWFSDLVVFWSRGILIAWSSWSRGLPNLVVIPHFFSSVFSNIFTSSLMVWAGLSRYGCCFAFYFNVEMLLFVFDNLMRSITWRL